MTINAQANPVTGSPTVDTQFAARHNLSVNFAPLAVETISKRLAPLVMTNTGQISSNIRAIAVQEILVITTLIVTLVASSFAAKSDLNS
jgi:hypothetical protein